MSGVTDRFTPVPEKARLRDAGILARLGQLQTAVVALAQGRNLSAGPGLLRRTGDGAVVFSSEPRPPSRRHDYWPWDIIPILDNGQWKVKFWPGTLNGCFPTNMTDAFDVPQGDAYAKLRVSAAATGQISDIVIEVEGAPPPFISPTAEAIPTSFEVGVGFFSEGIYRRAVGTGALWACPRVAFAAPLPNPVPWGSALTRYWTWQIGGTDVRPQQ